LLVPQLLRLVWPLPSSGHAQTGDFFKPVTKLLYPLMVFRDHWALWDIAGSALLLGLVAWAWQRETEQPANAPAHGLKLGVLALAVIYALMPGTIFGSGMADMRMLPLMLIIALVAAAPAYPRNGWLSRARLAWLGGGFALARVLGNCVSLSLAGQAMAADLHALDSLPQGSRLASFVVEPCTVSILPWRRERRGHLGGYAIVRHHAFSNDQWVIPGGQLLQVHAPLAGEFATDYSQIAKQDGCDKPNTITRQLSRLPRAAFDYVWILDDGKVRAIPAATPVKRTAGSVLYRL
jgi:hypothetical protein